LFNCWNTEEIIFRGYLLPRLEILLKNKNLSVIISSLFFGLIHYGYGTSIQIIGPHSNRAFGVHYQKYRNIKILIICHFLWDLIALLVKLAKHNRKHNTLKIIHKQK
jgi:membrane protease YdiL (CAAX protease family)